MGSIKQSVTWWCLEQSGMAPEQLARVITEAGYQAVDLVGQEYWPLLKEHGLKIAAINGHQSITAGLNRREHHAQIEKELLASTILTSPIIIPQVTLVVMKLTIVKN